MNNEDSLIWLGWAEALMKQAEVQTEMTKLFSARIDLIESVLYLRASLDQKRHLSGAADLSDRLQQLEIEHGPIKAQLHEDLLDAAARSESAHDQIAASLERLRSQLEGGGGDVS